MKEKKKKKNNQKKQQQQQKKNKTNESTKVLNPWHSLSAFTGALL